MGGYIIYASTLLYITTNDLARVQCLGSRAAVLACYSMYCYLAAVFFSGPLGGEISPPKF